MKSEFNKPCKCHSLKIKREYYAAIVFGDKTFEIRKDDRGYEVGDGITFSDADTGEKLHGVWEITYILRNVPEYGLMDGYVVLSLERIGRIEGLQ